MLRVWPCAGVPLTAGGAVFVGASKSGMVCVLPWLLHLAVGHGAAHVRRAGQLFHVGPVFQAEGSAVSEV